MKSPLVNSYANFGQTHSEQAVARTHNSTPTLQVGRFAIGIIQHLLE